MQTKAIDAVEAIAVPRDDQEQLSRVTSLIASAFRTVPISLATMNTIDGNVYDLQKLPSYDRCFQHFKGQIQQIAASGSMIVQAGDWSVVAIWESPDHVPTKSKSTVPIVEEYREKCKLVKQRHLQDPSTEISKIRPFYYLDFIARDSNIPSVPGAISAVIKPFLERAKNESVPVWLEAVSQRVVKIYEHYGFRFVEEIVVGKGDYDANGVAKANGEGLSVFAMIWDEHLR